MSILPIFRRVLNQQPIFSVSHTNNRYLPSTTPCNNHHFLCQCETRRVFSLSTQTFDKQQEETDKEENSNQDENNDSSDDERTKDSTNNKQQEEEGQTEVTTRLAQVEKQLADCKDQLLRSMAERENIRKIAANDVEKAKAFAVSSFAKSLLEVSDNLERAMEDVKDEYLEGEENKHFRTFYEGVTLTNNVLHSAFRSVQVTRFNPEGEEFNPNKHSALFQVPKPDAPPKTVAVVVKSGYMIRDRVLRPAEVGVVPDEQ
mmetsp:Transcript_4338/g.6512  ORF Transcript_4338/g.6512 Transcript_4338/m.6512 type:complete len:259 (+) Transcript_4338:67-843(+)|eukprot:CAMPEP_0201551814 /NCGR_PEP_ID=MMETSP0173_2-20130828/10439_1 /ASSEMBLY_ACC=CAM_ASM_000268 /TAXON_ID=218659 /ORGANISM="Vexillifera sp., Strain DIVA3 564/2" /LENGTH=258 /DNA_ID=CAMNT_0047962157 /DNA_START=44 /DNA_END=820 /DNA_ORIENTATION=+